MTMMRHTTARLLSVGFLVAFVAGVGLLAAAPFFKWTELREQYQDDQERLSSLESQLVRETSLRKENEELMSSGQDASLLIVGKTTGIAGANLQRLLNGLILESHGSPTTSQINAPKTEGDLIRISMTVSLTVDTDGLRSLLHSVETRTPLIFIDDITVTAESEEVWKRRDPHYLGPLDVTLQVSAFTSTSKASKL